MVSSQKSSIKLSVKLLQETKQVIRVMNER